MPSNLNREYRNMELRTKKPEAEENNYIADGYATTFNEPYLLYRDGDYDVWEQVDRSAFFGTDQSDVIFQFDHSGMVYARTRNNTLTLSEDDHGLNVVADLSSTEASRGIWDAIDKGLIDRMSFAFTVAEDEYVEEDLGNGRMKLMRTIKRIGKLYDVSAVSLPANEGTSISARTKELCDGEIKKFEAERLHAQEIKELRSRILAHLDHKEV